MRRILQECWRKTLPIRARLVIFSAQVIAILIASRAVTRDQDDSDASRKFRGPAGLRMIRHCRHVFPHDPRREPMSRTRIPVSRLEENSRLMAERLEMSTAEIGLSVRTTNCLEERGIFTVRDLLNSTPEQLLSIANFGEKTLEEVYKALEKFGFYRASRKEAVGVSA